MASSTLILLLGIGLIVTTLKFKAAPDFEKPGDADKNNVYEVTITAVDGNANMATRDVKVTVTNAEEDGTVKLSQPRPRVGVAITASYSDLDGGVGQRYLAVVEDRLKHSGCPEQPPPQLSQTPKGSRGSPTTALGT